MRRFMRLPDQRESNRPWFRAVLPYDNFADNARALMESIQRDRPSDVTVIMPADAGKD